MSAEDYGNAEPRKQKVQAIQQRGPSLGRRNKYQDTLSIGKTQSKAIWAIQSSGTVIGSHLLTGDTSALEDTQHVPCELNNAI